MLRAIFYARFHPRRGPAVIHQHPPESVIHPSGRANGLLNFSNITSYIIPSYELCNQPLSICTGGYRVLGYPVSLEDERYELTERNRFTFNVCFVLTEDPTPWQQVVSKTASFFIALEESAGILQAEEQLHGLKWAGDDGYPAAGVGKVYELLQSTFSQLNRYGETCVRVNDIHVLNLRLAASISTVRKVNEWEVPLLIRALPNDNEWTWDLALKQMLVHIDGVNHVQRIAELADVEVSLVAKVVQELLRHQRVMLLDIFHFQAVYILTEDFAWFVKDEGMKDECARYVTTGTAVSPPSLVELYSDLGPGITVKDFYIAHERQLNQIDIRRFITFGVVKGFIRRVHKMAFSLRSQEVANGSAPSNESPTKTVSSLGLGVERDQAWKRAAFSSGWTTPPTESRPTTAVEIEKLPVQDAELLRFLDGKHCLDEACVSLHLTEKQVLEKVRTHGDFVVLSK